MTTRQVPGAEFAFHDVAREHTTLDDVSLDSSCRTSSSSLSQDFFWRSTGAASARSKEHVSFDQVSFSRLLEHLVLTADDAPPTTLAPAPTMRISVPKSASSTTTTVALQQEVSFCSDSTTSTSTSSSSRVPQPPACGVSARETAFVDELEQCMRASRERLFRAMPDGWMVYGSPLSPLRETGASPCRGLASVKQAHRPVARPRDHRSSVPAAFGTNGREAKTSRRVGGDRGSTGDGRGAEERERRTNSTAARTDAGASSVASDSGATREGSPLRRVWKWMRP